MYALSFVKGSYQVDLTLRSQAECFRTLRKLQRKGAMVRFRVLRFNGLGWEDIEVL